MFVLATLPIIFGRSVTVTYDEVSTFSTRVAWAKEPADLYLRTGRVEVRISLEGKRREEAKHTQSIKNTGHDTAD